MASRRTKGPEDTYSECPAGLETASQGERRQLADPSSPQPDACNRSTETSLDNTTLKPAGYEQESARDLSPVRPQWRAPGPGTRSRENSQETSPNRLSVNGPPQPTPSAAAIQRALSAHKISLNPTAMEISSEIRNLKSTGSTPRWPTSPRLTSPPPSATRNSTYPTRKQDVDMAAPNTSQKRASASVPDISTTTAQTLPEKDDIAALRASLKTPGRGPSSIPPVLETVSENGVPNTPVAVPSSEQSTIASSTDVGESRPTEASQETSQSKSAKGSGDSESDSTGAKPSGESTSMPPPGPAAGGKPSSNMTRKSSTNLAAIKSKAAEPLTRSMTVETETVASVPQAPMNAMGERGASGKLDANGSVRLKPSNELMKPKKEKKRITRRPASINTSTISSKADIFEAKVATAVDEANSSDSDETFVYESNPPEPYVPRSARHHSRTPSATSLASQIEQRSKSVVRDGQHKVAGKRSMKFANYNSNLDGELGMQAAGRGGGKIATTPRHHHISRHSRGPSHVGLFDNESPFTQANKVSSPRVPSARSRPNSPRFTGGRAPATPRKSEAYAFDADEGVADDERMPLIGSVRVNRSRHSRRSHQGGSRQIDYFEGEQRSPLSRYGACLLVTCLFVILCVGAGSFIVALSKSLVGVSISEMKSVLATEQELMFDLKVRTINPNLFTITVSDLNIDIFAKSGYAGTAAEWREHGSHSPWRRSLAFRSTRKRAGRHSHHAGGASDAGGGAVNSGVDEGTDPIDDPSTDPQTMVLGRVFEFDSPLVFESSPIRRQVSTSLGEIRLTQPGNKTEEGGSARWEKVIQHPFELIIGGALKYQLPLSSKTRSVSVRSHIKVNPKESDDDDQPRLPAR